MLPAEWLLSITITTDHRALTATRQQKHTYSKATSSHFLCKMIAKLKGTQTTGATIRNESTATEQQLPNP